jgi:hypothetical protein
MRGMLSPIIMSCKESGIRISCFTRLNCSASTGKYFCHPPRQLVARDSCHHFIFRCAPAIFEGRNVFHAACLPKTSQHQSNHISLPTKCLGETYRVYQNRVILIFSKSCSHNANRLFTCHMSCRPHHGWLPVPLQALCLLFLFSERWSTKTKYDTVVLASEGHKVIELSIACVYGRFDCSTSG